MTLTGCGSEEEVAAPTDETSTLIFGRGGDSVSLDPANVTDGESLIVTTNVFDTLINYAESTTDLIPGLATSWEPSEDGLTWTFKLRDDVKFHDGSPLTVEDVKFTFDFAKEVKAPITYLK